MADGPVYRVIIQHSQSQTQNLGLLGELGDEVGPAHRAEASVLARG